MSKAVSLTKNPTLVTAILSVAALTGYASYRLTIANAQTEPVVSATATASEAAAAELLATRLASELPDIVIEDLAGSPTSIAGLAGRPLLVNFWATWCAPCLREIPLLKEFHSENSGIDVLGIAVDDPEPVHEFAAEIDFNYQVLVGESAAYEAMAWFRNDAQAMPFSAFTDSSGAVIGIHYGELHAEHLDCRRSRGRHDRPGAGPGPDGRRSVSLKSPKTLRNSQKTLRSAAKTSKRASFLLTSAYGKSAAAQWAEPRAARDA